MTPPRDEGLRLATARAVAAATSASIFVLLLEYMKLLAAEHNEDAKLAREATVLALAAKAAQLDQENAAIDQAMKEAGERADIAIGEAKFEMVIGIVSALAAGDTKEQINKLTHDLEALKDEVHRLRQKLKDDDDDD